MAAGAPSNLHVTLTDLFPNVDAYSLILARDNHVSGDVRPVDIERDVIAARGVRTLFSSFHHFNPATAARVLNNLSRTGDPIFIAEGTHRSALAIFFMLLAPLFVWLATPMLRPFKWSRLALTYLVPVIPFVVCFDGIVSCLRTYTVDELRALLRTLDDLRYEWTVAEAHGSAPMPVTYAIGVPKARRS